MGRTELIRESRLPHDGPVSEKTYGNGDKVSYQYNKREEITQVSYDGVLAFRYRYDSLGNELFHEDLVNGIDYFFVYDSLGRTVRMRSSDGGELEIGYDDRNRTDRFVSLADGTGTELQYTYGNAAGGQMADAVYGVRVDGKDLETITYDRYGRTASRKLLLTEPAAVSYTYLKGTDGGDTLLPETMTMTVNGTTYGYAYDCHGNLTSVTENGTEILRYTYDFLDELVRTDDRTEGKSHAWSYDAGGNRTEERIYPYTTGTLGSPEKTISYGYGDEKWKDKLTDYNGQTLTYDAIGNPISYRDGMTFAWQHGRELKSLTAGDTYDEDGYRMTKTDESGVTRYYRNGTTLLTQKKGNERLDFFYDADGLPLGFKENGTAYYYLLNLQGDIVGILTGEGKQVVSYRYDSWGKLLSSTGELAESLGETNPLRYRGYYYDSESGLYYLNSRYYDPETGRFLNADWQMDENAGLLKGNLYAYCANNPVKYQDDGGEGLLLALGIGFIAGAFISGINSCVVQENTTGVIDKKQVVIDAITGGISGSLAASGVGLVGQMIGNAAISLGAYGLTQSKNQEKVTLEGALESLALGATAGMIGGSGLYDQSFQSNVTRATSRSTARSICKVAGVISRRTIIRTSIQAIKNAANMAIGRFIAGAGYVAAANALAAMAKNKRIRKKR